MNRRIGMALLAVVTVASATLLGIVPTSQASAATGVSTTRLAGADRYATAVAIARNTFPNGAPIVFVASGENFPDALSAGPAAATLGGPLLLTDADSVPGDVATELKALAPTEIIVVGGASAVTPAALTRMHSLVASAKITRLAGSDRYATSRAVDSAEFVKATTVFIATGANYPDALSAASAAGSAGDPVLLVNGRAGSLDAATRSELRSLGATSVEIAGGRASVSSGIQAQLRALLGADHVTRTGGPDRYATSALVASTAFPTAQTAYLATGSGFPDALAGSAAAGALHAPLLTVSSNCIPAPVASYLDSAGVASVKLLGGPSALTTSVSNLTPCPGAPAIRGGAAPPPAARTLSLRSGTEVFPHGGPASQSTLYAQGLATDAQGDLYVADPVNALVEKITPDGTLSILAGTGRPGKPVNGPATASPLDEPHAVATDAAGDVYVADEAGYVVRIDPAGRLTVIAGTGTDKGPVAGAAVSSPIGTPLSIAVDASDDVFVGIANGAAGQIVEITPSGALSVAAGTGAAGKPVAGPATESPLQFVDALAFAPSGTMYLAADTSVDEISPHGELSVAASVVASAIAIDPQGDVALSLPTDPDNDSGTTAELSSTGALSEYARVYGDGIAFDTAGDFYAGRGTFSQITKISPAGAQSDFAGTAQRDGALQGQPSRVAGLATDSAGDVFTTVSNSAQVTRTTPTGTVSVIAGAGTGDAPVAGDAAGSPLWGPDALATDSAGDLYIADGKYVEKVTPQGTLSVLVGPGSRISALPPFGSQAAYTTSIAVDRSGNVYVGVAPQDVMIGRVLKITPNDTLSVFVGAGSGATPVPGPAVKSPLAPPAVATDRFGNVYITSDTYLTKVTPAGVLSVIAGDAQSTMPTPGPAVGHSIGFVDSLSYSGLAIDASGDIYLTTEPQSSDIDAHNFVEEIDPSGRLSMIAGDGADEPPAPGPAAASGLSLPGALALGSQGDVLVASGTDVVRLSDR